MTWNVPLTIAKIAFNKWITNNHLHKQVLVKLQHNMYSMGRATAILLDADNKQIY